MINALTADLPKMHILRASWGGSTRDPVAPILACPVRSSRKSLCGTVLQQSTDQRATSWESRAQCGGDRL